METARSRQPGPAPPATRRPNSSERLSLCLFGLTLPAMQPNLRQRKRPHHQSRSPAALPAPAPSQPNEPGQHDPRATNAWSTWPSSLLRRASWLARSHLLRRHWSGRWPGAARPAAGRRQPGTPAARGRKGGRRQRHGTTPAHWPGAGARCARGR